MKHATRYFLWLLPILLVLAFTPSATTFTEGTFGVGANDPSHIKLQLKADHTFTYQDLSVASAPVKVSGTWSLRQATIQLKSDQKIRFHHTWHLSADQQMVKGRKGLCWYSLCRQ